jgi:tellurite resistance protein
MKVNRYKYGRSNISMLESQRAGLVSPEKMAAGTAAPYVAAADIAGEAADTINVFNERKQRKEDEQDATLIATKTAVAQAEVNTAIKQAEAEGWTEDQYKERITEIIRGHTDDLDEFKDRNRVKAGEIFGRNAAVWLQEAETNAIDIRTQRTNEKWAAGYNAAAATKDWPTMEFLNDMGFETNVIDEATRDQNRRNISGGRNAEILIEDYKTAKAEGTEDDLLLKMSNMGLTNEDWAAFDAERKDYDYATEVVENELRVARKIDFSKTLMGIDATTTIEEIDAYVNSNKHLTGGEIAQLYSAHGAAKEVDSILGNPYRDNGSKKVREALDKRLVLYDPDGNPTPPEEVFDQAIAIAIEEGASPAILSNMYEYFTTTPSNIQMAGNKYIAQQKVAPNVQTPMADRPRAVLEFYKNLVLSRVDPATASNLTFEKFDKINEQTIDANYAAWDNPELGSKAGESPSDMAAEEMTSRLQDENTPLGQAFIADLGEGWFNLMDKYGKDTIRPSALMKAQLNRTAKIYYGISGSEEVAVNGALYALRAQGYAATDVNYDVPVTSLQAEDGKGKGFEIQMNPITRVGGQVVPRETVRAMIADDIKGAKFTSLYAPPGSEPREYSVNELEVGDGVMNINGFMQWPLKHMGSILLHSSGPLKNTPVFVRYPEPQTEEARAEEKEAAKIVKDHNKVSTEVSINVFGGPG